VMSDNKSLVVAKLIFNNATYFFETPDFDVAKGYLIVIETENGPEVASVSGITYTVPEDIQIGKILRVCNEDDLRKIKENEKREEEAFKITLEKIKKHDLDMKLVNIHYFLDDNKIIFNFTADERVDFRELVKDLASVFKKRIELRQIGARDEAKIVKGFGICGRDFCCNTVKHELKPVTIKMAKDQNLTLNSSKISGACGRLLCCLAYEHDAYCEIKNNYPSEGSKLEYDGNTVTLTEINILKMIGTVKTGDDVYIQIPLDELPNLVKKQQEKQELVVKEE
jgi:cell fate regulator YaaT (PSP1 superfamily)